MCVHTETLSFQRGLEMEPCAAGSVVSTGVTLQCSCSLILLIVTSPDRILALVIFISKHLILFFTVVVMCVITVCLSRAM